MKNFILFSLLFCFGVLFASPPQITPPVKSKITVDVGIYQNVSCVDYCEFSLPSNDIFQDFKNTQWKQNNIFLSQNPANYKGKNYTNPAQSKKKVPFISCIMEVNSDIFIVGVVTKTPILAGESFSQTTKIPHTLTRWLFGNSKVTLCGK
jgi:hypothetical protein